MYKLSILEITKSPSFNDSVAKVMSESCPCLRVLNANRTGLGDEGLIAFGQNSLTFVALDISNTSVSVIFIRDNFRRFTFTVFFVRFHMQGFKVSSPVRPRGP